MPLLARDRRDKAVAAARDVADIARSRAAITECLAQRGYMDPQGPLVDDRIRPSAGDQLILVNGLAGAFNQRNKDVQSSAAETQLFPILEQHALRGDQAERSKDEAFFIHRKSSYGAFRFIPPAKILAMRDGKTQASGRDPHGPK